MRRKRRRYKFEERVYTFPGSREVERIRTGPPLDKEKRGKRKKATPEQVKKQNEYNRQKQLRRVIKENFTTNDYWITLTYQRGHVLELEEAVKHRQKFLRIVRQEYAIRGHTLKWIGRTERGKRGAVHHHLILNRIADTDIIVSVAWKKIKESGRAKMELLYEKGQFKDLAAYITKADDVDENGDSVTRSNYSRSRNLVIPEPEIRRTSLKKILFEPEPAPGYYIDKDSICQGINIVTGREYLHYIEIRIKGGGG